MVSPVGMLTSIEVDPDKSEEQNEAPFPEADDFGALVSVSQGFDEWDNDRISSDAATVRQLVDDPAELLKTLQMLLEGIGQYTDHWMPGPNRTSGANLVLFVLPERIDILEVVQSMRPDCPLSVSPLRALETLLHNEPTRTTFDKVFDALRQVRREVIKVAIWVDALDAKPGAATANNDRDKWIYEQLFNLDETLAQIRLQLSKQDCWRTIHTDEGIRKAGLRYAANRGLEPPPKRS